MTNKSKGKKGRKGLKLLDLSFEGQPTQQSSGFKTHIKSARTRTAPVAYRPHGGYRGTKSHPPSPYSFNKSADYQGQIQTDLDQLVADDQWTHSTSPAWAIDVSNEMNHTGESPLFVHRFLAPSKHDRRQEYRVGQHALSGKQRPLSANDAARYRPNSTHQYLTTTELKNASQSEIDLRLGKPTRTTLLRARQRVNSAPQNAYDTHRDQVKKAERIAETRRSLGPGYSLQDLLGFALEEESLHSFLIGARYNRAHYVDAKTLVTQGVYMPRANPGGCFVIPRNKPKETEVETPPAPPDSPVDFDGVDIQSTHVECSPRSPAPPPQRPPSPSPLPPPQRPPSPQPHTAWSEDNRAELELGSAHLHMNGDRARDEGPVREAAKMKDLHKIRDPAEKDNNLGSMRRLLTLDDGLNVKGKGLENMNIAHSRIRPISARNQPTGARSVTPTLPSVMITGTSYSHSQTRGDPLDQSLLVSRPIVSPAPRIISPRGRLYEEKKARMDDKAPVQMEDKSFNVPSINGDIEEEVELAESVYIEGEVGESHVVTLTESQIGEQAGNGLTSGEDTDHHGNEMTEAVTGSNSVRRASSARSRKSRVRFADDAVEEAVDVAAETQGEMANKSTVITREKGENNGSVDAGTKDDDNVAFFMTEEEATQTDNGQGENSPVQGQDSQGHTEDCHIEDSLHTDGADAVEESQGHLGLDTIKTQEDAKHEGDATGPNEADNDVFPDHQVEPQDHPVEDESAEVLISVDISAKTTDS